MFNTLKFWICQVLHTRTDTVFLIYVIAVLGDNRGKNIPGDK